MTNCNTCWGTGFYHGIGGPCKEGCKPPTKKHGLSAVTNSDAATGGLVIGVDPAPGLDSYAELFKPGQYTLRGDPIRSAEWSKLKQRLDKADPYIDQDSLNKAVREWAQRGKGWESWESFDDVDQ